MSELTGEDDMDKPELDGPVTELPDNVVAIKTKFTEAPPVDRKPRDYLACQHEHTMLDDKLRTVGCRDCGEERLDPFEVLMHLANVWHRWHREAEQLRKLNLEYRDNQRDKWERARDRHLRANPEHSGSFNPRRRFENRGGWRRGEQPCPTCDRIEQDFDPRWFPTPAPDPPPGKLGGASTALRNDPVTAVNAALAKPSPKEV